jgi:hypothetical protein
MSGRDSPASNRLAAVAKMSSAFGFENLSFRFIAPLSNFLVEFSVNLLGAEYVKA